MRFPARSVAIISAGLAASMSVQAQQTGPTACSDLASGDFANTTITIAEMVAAGMFEGPGPRAGPFAADYSQLPAFCRVAGTIAPTSDSDIRFELWLPTPEAWNGNFMQTGNGGAAGSIVYRSLIDPLMRGYAVANTDTGHRGGGADFSWAVGHPEKLVDYQYRAVHELTVIGKMITDFHYGQEHDKAYWFGCSQGGRQGLKEAQRYPTDYDGIVVGAPASNWVPLMGLYIHFQRNIGPEGLNPENLGLLTEGAIAACDADDGVADRVIASPGTCDFDPATLQCGASTSTTECLAASEVAAANRIYAGLVNAAGDVVFPGTGPGSETQWASYASPQSLGSNYFQSVVLNDPDWDLGTFDVDRDVDLAEAQDAGATDAMDPDLSAFIERGGKLLAFHGTTDGSIPYGNSVNYHESVIEELGQDAVANSVRLYLVPGMNHCGGGNGAHRIDWLTAIEDWVDSGQTPGALHAEHPATAPGIPGAPAVAPSGPFTRVVCPYPEVARYDGIGNDTDAVNFQCVAPAR